MEVWGKGCLIAYYKNTKMNRLKNRFYFHYAKYSYSFSLYFKLEWNRTRTYFCVIHSLTGVIVTGFSNLCEGVVGLQDKSGSSYYNKVSLVSNILLFAKSSLSLLWQHSLLIFVRTIEMCLHLPNVCKHNIFRANQTRATINLKVPFITDEDIILTGLLSCASVMKRTCDQKSELVFS